MGEYGYVVVEMKKTPRYRETALLFEISACTMRMALSGDLRVCWLGDEIAYQYTAPQIMPNPVTSALRAANSLIIGAESIDLLRYHDDETWLQIQKERAECLGPRMNCSKCGHSKPISAFVRGRRQCKKCRQGQIKAWKHENPERAYSYSRNWIAKNRERYRERTRAYNRKYRDIPPERYRGPYSKTA